MDEPGLAIIQSRRGIGLDAIGRKKSAFGPQSFETDKINDAKNGLGLDTWSVMMYFSEMRF